MHLVNNWRAVLARAWSIRLMILAGVLSGVEAGLAMFPDVFSILQISQGYAAVASMAITCTALWARVVAQKGVTDGP